MFTADPKIDDLINFKPFELLLFDFKSLIGDFKNLERNFQAHSIELRRQCKRRIVQFDKHFKKFKQVFYNLQDQLNAPCQSMYIKSKTQTLTSKIKLKIRKTNDDDDEALYCSTLNSHRAALWLQMAINLTIDSPLLIFDSFDYLFNKNERNSFNEFLVKLAETEGIQIISMFNKPLDVLQANEILLMWKNNQVSYSTVFF